MEKKNRRGSRFRETLGGSRGRRQPKMEQLNTPPQKSSIYTFDIANDWLLGSLTHGLHGYSLGIA
jgi:hypothetical protein